MPLTAEFSDYNDDSEVYTWKEILARPGMYREKDYASDNGDQDATIIVPAISNRPANACEVMCVGGYDKKGNWTDVGSAYVPHWKKVKFVPYYGSVTITNTRE